MKKLTLFKGKAIACLILMCLALAQGCKKDLLQPNSKDFQNGLSIAEAKKYFEANVKQIAKTKKLMSSGSVTPNINEESAEEILNSRELIWESAYQKLISTGNAVKIPLNFGKTYAVVDAAKKELIPFGSLNYLFMYKDSLQKIHTEWVILLPDKAWLYGKRDQYTGKIVVKDWEGNFIKSYDYKGITPVKSLSLFPGKLNNRMANSAPETAVPPTDPTDPTNPDVWVICITKCHEFCGETIVDSRKCIMMRNPEDPEGGGGGGGGGSSNGGGRNDGSPGFGQGGGGAAGSDYFPPSGPNCNPDPTYTMPSYPAPLGYSWIMKCDQPGAVPLPTGPTINSSRLNSIINFMGITDPDKQNFLLTHDDIYEAFENYLVTNGDSPENKEFIDWAAGYLIENTSSSAQDLIFLNKMPNSSIILPNLDVSELDAYPEFKNLVKNLPNFLNRYPNVLKAISYTTGFSENKIMQLMQPGKGPKVVVIKNLKDKNGYDILGHYDKDTKTLQIDDGYVNGLSIVNSPERYQGIGLILVISTLHEFAHFGTNENALLPVIAKRLKNPGYEPGWYFEDTIAPTGVSRLIPENAFEWMKYYKIRPKK